MWLPPFVKRGIHFLGERTKALSLNDSVFLNRFHLPIIGNRAGIVNSHESNAVTIGMAVGVGVGVPNLGVGRDLGVEVRVGVRVALAVAVAVGVKVAVAVALGVGV